MPRGTALLRTPNTESTTGLFAGLPSKCDWSTRTPYVTWKRGVRRYESPSHPDAPRSSPNRRFTCRRRVKLAGIPFSRSDSELYVYVPNRLVVLSCE